MVPAWDNGDIRPCAVAAVQHCNVQLFKVNGDIRPCAIALHYCAIALNCSKSLGMSGMKWYHRAQNDPGRHKGRILAQKCTPLFEIFLKLQSILLHEYVFRMTLSIILFAFFSDVDNNEMMDTKLKAIIQSYEKQVHRQNSS